MGEYDIDLRGRFYTIEELEALRRKYAKRANQRLLRLERAGLDYYAYDRAMLYLERTRKTTRFSESKTFKGNKQALLRELDSLTTFLSSRTSTVAGQRSIEREKIKSFENKGYNVGDPRQFFNFLSSSAYKTLANSKIPSEILIEFLTKSRDAGKSLGQIYGELEKFKTGAVSGVDTLFKKFGISMGISNK